MSERQEFLARVEVREDGCWSWHGARRGGDTRFGNYGGFGQHGYAHRWAFEEFVGPIPDGTEIDHLCRNKRCVNPAHLEPVTHQENIKRWRDLTTHCPHGHAYAGGNLYVDPDGARRCRACRREGMRKAYAKRGAA